MTVKCSVFIATSVDGFIADADGGIEWLLNPAYGEANVGDFGYAEFIATVDGLVMGRHSFEKVLTFSDWPYETPVVVLSSRGVYIPQHLQSKVTVDRGTPHEVVGRLASTGKRHVYIDGGITVQRFLQAQLIHEFTITRIPILLGGGISLFGSIGSQVHLRLLETKSFENGFVQIKYEAVYGE